MSDTKSATSKEKAIFYLKSLIELIENDRIAAARIDGLTNSEVIALAEVEAEKVAAAAKDLANRA